ARQGSGICTIDLVGSNTIRDAGVNWARAIFVVVGIAQAEELTIRTSASPGANHDDRQHSFRPKLELTILLKRSHESRDLWGGKAGARARDYLRTTRTGRVGDSVDIHCWRDNMWELPAR